MSLLSQAAVGGQVITLRKIGPDSNSGFEYQDEVTVVYDANLR